jgi:hypothetical protein
MKATKTSTLIDMLLATSCHEMKAMGHSLSFFVLTAPFCCS